MLSILLPVLLSASAYATFSPTVYEKQTYDLSGIVNLPTNVSTDTLCSQMYDVCQNVTAFVTGHQGYQINNFCSALHQSEGGPAETNVAFGQCQIYDKVLAVSVDYLDVVAKSINTTLPFPSRHYIHNLPSRRTYNNNRRLITRPIAKHTRARFCSRVKRTCPKTCTAYYEKQGDFTAEQINQVVTSHSKCSYNAGMAKASFYCWCQSKNVSEFASIDMTPTIGRLNGAYSIFPIPAEA